MELQEINLKLKETRDELLQIVNGLREDQLNKRKVSYSWSISQICQHLIKTEELYTVAIKRGLKSKEDSLIENKPVELLLDRSRKLEAPDIAKPSDEILAPHEIMEQLNNSREKLYELLNSVEDPSILSRRHFVPQPLKKCY